MDFIHKKLLVIMDYVHNICVKESIEYSLAYGTMLGAARHKGFIPWDDDADIFMLRGDYEKFREAVTRYPSDELYFREHKYWIKKIVFKERPTFNGKNLSSDIALDIFILDELPATEKERRQQIFSLRKYQGMLSTECIFRKDRTFKDKVLLIGTRIMGKFHSRKNLCIHYDNISKKYAGTGAEEYFNSNNSFRGITAVFKKEWLTETEDCPFEERVYKIFSAYQEMLSFRYGDYMTPPPEAERLPPHIKTL